MTGQLLYCHTPVSQVNGEFKTTQTCQVMSGTYISYHKVANKNKPYEFKGVCHDRPMTSCQFT